MDLARFLFEYDDGSKPAVQCKSGTLVERWSLPPTPCDAFAQEDLLPFGCDDLDFPSRHSHLDLRLQPDQIHVRHPTGSLYGDSQTVAQKHKEPQMTLLEHYAKLKIQRRVKSVAQTHEQNMCALTSYTPATPHSPVTSCSSQIQLPCPAPDNHAQAAQSSDRIHNDIVHSDTSNFASSPCKDTTMKEIFQHPWVASHLQDLSSCFSAGKAEEHLTHLLDLKQKGGRSLSMSHDSHAPSSSSPTNSTSPSKLQDLQFMSQDGAVQPQLPPIASTFSTVLPLCSPEQAAPMAFRDSPSVYTRPPLSEQKAPAVPASSCDPVISPQSFHQPTREVRLRRHLKYSELAATESDTEPDTSPCKGKCDEEQALGLHRLRPRTAFEKELQVHEDEEFLDAELRSSNRRCKHHNPWTLEETLTLVRGVEDCGGGKWADIKKRKYRSIENRSAVDLKDKWRNLMRVAVLPAAALRTKCAKRRELPLELLVKVRTLNAMHSKAKAGSNAAHPDSAFRFKSCARQSQAA
ncbi:hypothetical protein WJX77_007826 [Trebouxia sp. C0004]